MTAVLIHTPDSSPEMPVKAPGPSVKRGRSRQDYNTPPEFIEAVERRFGAIAWDLAATRQNCVGLTRLTEQYFTREQDSLAQDWGALDGVLWLNPEFDDIGPWAAKCESVRHRRDWTLLLVPASIGTEWYAHHVLGKAHVDGLRPRMKFVGCADPYPKDLMLAAYGFGISGFGSWRWKP